MHGMMPASNVEDPGSVPDVIILFVIADASWFWGRLQAFLSLITESENSSKLIEE